MIDVMMIKDIAVVLFLLLAFTFGNTIFAKEYKTKGRFIDRFDETQGGMVSRSEYP